MEYLGFLLTVGYAKDLSGTVLGIWNFYQASASTNRFNFTYLVILVLIIILVPSFILIFYPVSCFRTHFLERVFFKFDRSQLTLKVFMDSLKVYYKDGMEPNTRDHRYMAGLYLLLRFIMYLELIWTLYSNFTPLIVTTLTALSFFSFITKPYNTIQDLQYTVHGVPHSLVRGHARVHGCIARKRATDYIHNCSHNSHYDSTWLSCVSCTLYRP